MYFKPTADGPPPKGMFDISIQLHDKYAGSIPQWSSYMKMSQRYVKLGRSTV